jgi:hypothetical protein
MAPHQYGRHLHILTPAGADGAHGGPQPWEGITGRVKQETNRLMAEMQRSHAAMNTRADANEKAIKGVEAKLEAKLENIEQMLSALLDQTR